MPVISITHVLTLPEEIRSLSVYDKPIYFQHQHEIIRGFFPIIASVQPDDRHVAYTIIILGNCA